MKAELIALRLIHILGGIYWVGSGLFSSIFLFPALAQAGPAAGQLVAALQRRRLFVVTPIVAILTVLSGLRLMWITSAGFSAAYFATPSGRAFAVAGGAAILSLLVGLAIARPAGIRAGQAAQALARAAAATPDERAKLEGDLRAVQRTAARSGAFAVLLLVVAAAGMAVARYL